MKDTLVKTLYTLCAIDGPIPEGTTGVSVPEEISPRITTHPFYVRDSGTTLAAWVNKTWLARSAPLITLPLSLCQPHELMSFHRKGSYQCARKGMLIRALDRLNNPIPEWATHVYFNRSLTTHLRYTRHDSMLWQAASRMWEPVNRETISLKCILPFTLLSEEELSNFRASDEPKVDLYEAKLVERYLAEKWLQPDFREEPASTLNESLLVEPTIKPSKPLLVEPTIKPSKPLLVEPTIKPSKPLLVEPTIKPSKPLLVEPTIKPSVKAAFPANAMLTIDFPYHMGGSFGGDCES